MNFIRIALFGLLAAGVVQAQTIRTVDNNVNAPAVDNVLVFSSLQAAHDAADPGDIIHIIGSPSSYGDATFTKELHLFGIGITPDKDVAHNSYVHNIAMEVGASGSTIEGLHFLSGWLALRSTIRDVSVRRCFFNGSYIDEQDAVKTGILISDNIFQRGTSWVIHLDYFANQDIVIRNNIFMRAPIYVTRGLVANNIFVANGVVNAIGGANLSQFNNNIYYRMVPVGGSATNCIFRNNYAFGSGSDAMPEPGVPIGSNTGENNIVGVPDQALFVNFPELGANTWSTAYDFHIESGSPVEGTGYDGTDMGIYGSSVPFDLTVELPIIQLLNTAAAVDAGAPLGTTVKTKSN